VELTVGRDLDLPGAAVEDLNFVVYPHVEVDGVLHEAVETELRVRDLPYRVAARASEEGERWSH